MALSPGTRLGPYEIVAPIGAGGMGEVYRGVDTRLDRAVAIKIILAHLAERAELRDRFEREARTVASLNHPHICVLYDVGRHDGLDFLVMEYLEGETLGRRLLKGPLPLDLTLQYAAEIADALDKAHSNNVTHRDLKPGNIMLTKSGTKLLDFGLAKLKQEAAPPAVPMSQLPTLTHLPTAHGAVVGTLQYMAPEQLEGKEIDGRTDIFAFGAVLYEMATGQKAFDGPSQAGVISAILTASPAPLSALQPMTPVALERVVKKCLAKEPEKRWQTASDLSDELKWIAQGSGERSATLAPQSTPVAATPKQNWIPLASIAAVALIALVGVILWLYKPTPSPPQQVSRFAISLSPGQRLAAVDQQQPALAISPDGSRLVYVANQGGRQQRVYLRNINSLDATAIPESENGYNPFFAADGRSVAFFVEGTLKKVAVTGGTPVSVASLPRISLPMGGAWAADGSYILGFGNLPTLQRIPTGGTLVPLTRLDLASGETSHMWPSLLPGDQALLYTVFRGPNQPPQTVIRTLATGEQHELLTGGDRPIYVASGHIVYADQGNLMAVPFDLKQLRVTGPPVVVIQGVMRCQQCGGGQFGISDNGVLVYIPEVRSAADRHLVWVDRAGKEQSIPAPPGTYGKPELSPDGQRIALGGEGQVRVYDIARDSFSQVAAGANPTWSPDGQRIAFQRQVNGEFHVFVQKADGTGDAEKLTTGPNRHAPGSFSPDGQLLAYTETDPVKGTDIWILRLSDHQAHPVITDPNDQGAAKFSPDGRWLVYVSNESGMREIYLRSSSGAGTKLKISTDGGVEPLWNRNGREILYRNGDQVLAVDVSTGSTLSAGKPRELFSAQYQRAQGNLPSWDVSSDGQRFAMLKTLELNVTQVNVVINWFEELKQKAPAGKQ
jgi:serine/threonine-protein kinase